MSSQKTVANSPPVIVSQLINVSKIYGHEEAQVRALDDISLEFKRGEFVAIMGPSGSGKSTLLHCAAGLDQVSRGQVKLEGLDMTRLSDAQLTKLRRHKVGFIFQAYNLIPILNVKENILLPLRITNLHQLGKNSQTFFKYLVEILGIQHRLNHMPSQLSGGQQQRVAAARALITRPAVIFADEPTGNLDSKASDDLLDFLRNAREEFQQTIIMVTHSARVASFSQRVIFMQDGRLVDTLENPTVKSISQKMSGLETAKV